MQHLLRRQAAERGRVYMRRASRTAGLHILACRHIRAAYDPREWADLRVQHEPVGSVTRAVRQWRHIHWNRARIPISGGVTAIIGIINEFRMPLGGVAGERASVFKDNETDTAVMPAGIVGADHMPPDVSNAIVHHTAGATHIPTAATSGDRHPCNVRVM